MTRDTERSVENTVNDDQEWRAFVEAWWRVQQERTKAGQPEICTPTSLRDLALRHDLLLGRLGENGERSQVIRMGKVLLAQKDRIYSIGKGERGVAVTVRGRKDGHSKCFGWWLAASEGLNHIYRNVQTTDSEEELPTGEEGMRYVRHGAEDTYRKAELFENKEELSREEERLRHVRDVQGANIPHEEEGLRYVRYGRDDTYRNVQSVDNKREEHVSEKDMRYVRHVELRKKEEDLRYVRHGIDDTYRKPFETMQDSPSLPRQTSLAVCCDSHTAASSPSAPPPSAPPSDPFEELLLQIAIQKLSNQPSPPPPPAPVAEQSPSPPAWQAPLPSKPPVDDDSDLPWGLRRDPPQPPNKPTGQFTRSHPSNKSDDEAEYDEEDEELNEEDGEEPLYREYQRGHRVWVASINREIKPGFAKVVRREDDKYGNPGYIVLFEKSRIRDWVHPELLSPVRNKPS